MTRLSAVLFVLGLPSAYSQPVYGPSFPSAPGLNAFTPVGSSTFTPVGSSTFTPVAQTSFTPVTQASFTPVGQAYTSVNSYPLSMTTYGPSVTLSTFSPVLSPTPAPLYPSYPPYGPPVYAAPSSSMSSAYGPVAVSSNLATESTFQPFTSFPSTPLFASTALPSLPVYGSTSLPAVTLPPITSLPVYGSTALSAVASLPAISFRPVTTPVYGSTALPVYGSAPAFAVPAPTPVPISCRTQNQLDVVKCYGIISGCFITQCAADGAYSPKQCAVFPCSSDTGSCPQCWCVDVVTGIEVPFSRANTTAITCVAAAPANDLVLPVRVRFRYPVGGGGGGGNNNGLLLCLLRPSVCFGGGDGGLAP